MKCLYLSSFCYRHSLFLDLFLNCIGYSFHFVWAPWVSLSFKSFSLLAAYTHIKNTFKESSEILFKNTLSEGYHTMYLLLGGFSAIRFYCSKFSSFIRKYNHQHMHTILAFSVNVYLFVSRNTNVGIKIRI